MVQKVVMPRLSLTMTEGTVVHWYKKEGENVEKGEPVVEVLSEKVTYDVEATNSGVLRNILVNEGEDAPVNSTLAFIAAPGEQVPKTVEAAGEPLVKALQRKTKVKVLASPAAKRLAREHEIDLQQVSGTGPNGKIIERDVELILKKQFETHAKVGEIMPFTGLRKTVAERVSHSARNAPHITLNMEVDMSKAEMLRQQKKVSYNTILVKAVAEALKKHPLLNSSLMGDQITLFEDVNVGVAVEVEEGLLVPVVRNADMKSLEEVSSELKNLVEKGRQGSLKKEELSGGTFTISNLGMYDVHHFTPIINPPEAAILGVGKIVQKPTVINKEVSVKPTITLSLSFDHRVVDGAPAARFLQEIKKQLETPET